MAKTYKEKRAEEFRQMLNEAIEHCDKERVAYLLPRSTNYIKRSEAGVFLRRFVKAVKGGRV
jgi:hypothetical protein